jgi:hypothetical protein
MLLLLQQVGALLCGAAHRAAATATIDPATTTTADSAPAVDIDWADFLRRADLLYEWNTTGPGAKYTPTGWWNSAFLGNGNLGLQVVAGLHNIPQPSGLPPRPPPPPPSPHQRCCCCWNREVQPCNATSQCDQGGEGCVASGTVTKRYGRVTCATCSSHGCPPAPSPPPPPVLPPLASQPALRFEIGRLDITDDRLPGSRYYTGNLKSDRPRLALGYLLLRGVGEVQGVKMRLQLWDAQVSAHVTTAGGALNVTVITHARSDVNVIRIEPSGNERRHIHAKSSGGMGVGAAGCSGVEWTPIQGDALLAWQKQVPAGRYVRNPQMVTTQQREGDEVLVLSIQKLLSGNSYASAVKMVAAPDGSCTVYQSTQGRMAANASALDAVAAVNVASAAAGLSQLLVSHRAWWHGYYQQSFVSSGDTRLESFYWVQIYKAGSGTRGSVGPPSVRRPLRPF